MAEVAVVIARPQVHPFQHGIATYKWETLTENDTGEAQEDGGAADRSVQVAGTFGSGSVSIQGSNDGVNYVTLKDMAGEDLTFSAAGINSIRDNSLYTRPSTPTGSSVDLDITILVKAVR